MRFAAIGFGNLINMDRVLVVTGPDSSPIKRLIQDARERGYLVDASSGRKTRSVLVLDSDHIILSALEPGEILRHFEAQAETEGAGVPKEAGESERLKPAEA